MRQYEYMVLHVIVEPSPKNYESFLNAYGKEGWELVAKDGNMWYFKRFTGIISRG